MVLSAVFAGLWKPNGKRFCQQCMKHHRHLTTLKQGVDRYNGVLVDLSQVPEHTPEEQFRAVLADCLSQWREDKRTVAWLKVPIQHSRYIATAATLGFQFHHAEHNSSLLKLWLKENQPDRTPRFATHQVGVSGLVLREDTTEVLVVQDLKSQFSYWKFPGGLSNLGEDIADTAVREVFEETGIRSGLSTNSRHSHGSICAPLLAEVFLYSCDPDFMQNLLKSGKKMSSKLSVLHTEFQAVLALRQQHNQPGAFGRSDFFFVCRMSALTFDLNPCQEEISKCEWMKLAELNQNSNITSITRRMTELLLHGLHKGFDQVDVPYEEMTSVYKGLQYKLYHRPNPRLS